MQKIGRELETVVADWITDGTGTGGSAPGIHL